MKKKNKTTKQKISSKEQLLRTLDRLRVVAAVHGVLIMFMIAGGSIGYALYRSKGYLNPGRDEAKYQELSAGSNYSSIDYKLVTKLQEVLKSIAQF